MTWAKRMTSGAEISILRLGIAAAIPQLRLPDATVGRDIGRTEWDSVVEIGRSSKTLLLAIEGLRQQGIPIPATVSAIADNEKRRILAINGVNLANITRLSKICQNASLPFVLFKGPIGQFLAYGSHFLRPSSDIDILVHRHDFGRASNLLQNSGYDLPDECNRVWWTRFLGEQHFFPRHSHGATVDLHHRIQQPECPQPAHIGDYLAKRIDYPIGADTVPYLDRINAALLTSMSFVKSLVQHCVAAAYLADFCALFLALDAEERTELMHRARVQNIENTVRLTMACAHEIFGLAVADFPGLVSVNDLFGSDLAPAIFQPDNDMIRWPRLRRILWRLCDDRVAGQKIKTYLWVGGSFLVSKVTRQWVGSNNSEPTLKSVQA